MPRGPESSSRLTAWTLVVAGALGLGRAAAAEPLAGADLARARAAARAVEGELVAAVAQARAASVTIVGRHPNPPVDGGLQRPEPLAAVGSGILVGWRGTWVVTNHHVVDGEGRYEAVTSDGRAHRLRLRARNADIDLALLAFEDEPQGLRPVRLDLQTTPDSAPGAWVLATGNPFFLGQDGDEVATLGIVSGMRPADAEAYIDAPTLQHDAEINPGSSGGAVWSVHGELLGVNGTIATRARRRGSGPAHTGASFSVPVAAVRRFLTAALGPGGRLEADPVATTARPAVVAREPVRTGGPIAGHLGVRFHTALDRQGQPSGAVVSAVDRRSPAWTGGAAGLLAGDVVTRLQLDGRTYAIRSAQDVERMLEGRTAGTPVQLGFFRRGHAYAWSGRLASR